MGIMVVVVIVSYNQSMTAEARCAVILAGGRSQRFGADKARALWRERPLIDHVATALRAAKFRILIAGPTEHYTDVGYPCLEDTMPYAGPLAALADLWKHIDTDHLLLVACDMPSLSAPLLEAMWAVRDRYDIVALGRAHNDPSPLPAIYARSTQRVAQHFVAAGRRDLRALLQCRLRAGIWCPSCIARYDGAAATLRNINTPQDLSEMA